MAGIETMIISLREAGFPLILLWLLVLAMVYGILSHVDLPKSKVARGVIAIVAAFMVLFAAASTRATAFVENLMVSGIVIAFGLMLVIIFLEMTGAKKDGSHIFAKHPVFFGSALLVLGILIFIGAGGLGILNLPAIRITEPTIAMVFFIIIMAIAIFVLMKEGKGK